MDTAVSAQRAQVCSDPKKAGSKKQVNYRIVRFDWDNGQDQMSSVIIS
jgi:hypothetical protein